MDNFDAYASAASMRSRRQARDWLCCEARSRRRSRMELRHLRYFVALAEELSFTRAAAKMHVTQSTLSHQIRHLEEEVGQSLFERSPQGVVITDAGEAFLANAA